MAVGRTVAPGSGVSVGSGVTTGNTGLPLLGGLADAATGGCDGEAVACCEPEVGVAGEMCNCFLAC